MCTNPITISRTYPLIGTKQYVVPCGKCADCRKKKQAEFAALSLHQGLQSGSVFFFTFTYRNETTPIAIAEDPFNVDEPRVIGFERGCQDWLDSQGRFMNGVKFHKIGNDAEYERTCSLRREDVKLVLKHFRTICKERNLSLDSFKYAVFGEYGESHGRPHYHGLFFGLTPEQSILLRDLWSKRFGFCYVAPEPGARVVSLDDILSLSQYVSKYISKGVSSRWKSLEKYAEKPRRQSSLNFGDFSEDELRRLAFFYDGRDVIHQGLSKFSFLDIVSSRRSSLQIAGKSFPIPQRLKEKLFYEPDDSELRRAELVAHNGGRFVPKKTLVPSPRKRTKISAMVAAFKRSDTLDYSLGELRKNSSENFQQVADNLIKETQEVERSVVRSREETAQAHILTNLKKEKYG